MQRIVFKHNNIKKKINSIKYILYIIFKLNYFETIYLYK